MLATEVAHRARDRRAPGRRRPLPRGRPGAAVLALAPGAARPRRPPADAVPAEVRRPARGRDRRARARPDAGAAAATTLRTFAAVARLLAQRQPGRWSCCSRTCTGPTTPRCGSWRTPPRSCAAGPVLFVATVRTVDPRRHPAPRPGARRASPGWPHAGCPCRRSSVDAVAELLEEVLPDPDPALVEVLTRRTDGNPFFVLEMARLLAATGRATAEAAERLEVPDGIADVLRLRVLQLGRADPHRAGGRLGRRARRSTPAAADGGARATDVARRPRRGGRGRASWRRPAWPGSFRFVHALTRETVYADLPAGQRARWHALVGRSPGRAAGRATPSCSARSRTTTPSRRRTSRSAAEAAVDYGRQAAVAAERARSLRRGPGSLWTRTVEVERRDPGPRPGSGATRCCSRCRPRASGWATCTACCAALDEAVALAATAGRLRADGRGADQLPQLRACGTGARWATPTTPRRRGASRSASSTSRTSGCGRGCWANLGLEHYVAWTPRRGDRCGRRVARAGPRERRPAGAPRLPRRPRGRAVVARPRRRSAWPWRGSRWRRPTHREHEIAARFQLATALHHLGRAPEADEVMAAGAATSPPGCGTPAPTCRWAGGAGCAPWSARTPRPSGSGTRPSPCTGAPRWSGLPELTGLYTLAVPAARRAGARRRAGHGRSATPSRPSAPPWPARSAWRATSSAALRLLGEPTGLGGRLRRPLRRLPHGRGAGRGAAPRPGRGRRVAPAVRPTRSRRTAACYSLGSAAYFVGVGLAALGRPDEAPRHLEQAPSSPTPRAGSRRWVRASPGSGSPR